MLIKLSDQFLEPRRLSWTPMNSGIIASWKLLLVILFPIYLSLFIPLPSAKIFKPLFITTFSKHIFNENAQN